MVVVVVVEVVVVMVVVVVLVDLVVGFTPVQCRNLGWKLQVEVRFAGPVAYVIFFKGYFGSKEPDFENTKPIL